MAVALASERRRYRKQAIVLAVIAPLVAAGALELPSRWLGMSPAAGVALTTLLVAAVLWVTEAVPLIVASFVILACNVTWLVRVLERAGTAVESGRFLSPFFSNIILLFLGGFTLSAALHKFLLDERLARWVLRRTGTSPPRVLLGVMLVTAFLSMWMSNTATTAMMLALAMALLSEVAWRWGESRR